VERAVREARRKGQLRFEARNTQPRARAGARCYAKAASGAAMLGDVEWKGHSV